MYVKYLHLKRATHMPAQDNPLVTLVRVADVLCILETIVMGIGHGGKVGAS